MSMNRLTKPSAQMLRGSRRGGGRSAPESAARISDIGAILVPAARAFRNSIDLHQPAARPRRATVNMGNFFGADNRMNNAVWLSPEVRKAAITRTLAAEWPSH